MAVMVFTPARRFGRAQGADMLVRRPRWMRNGAALQIAVRKDALRKAGIRKGDRVSPSFDTTTKAISLTKVPEDNKASGYKLTQHATPGRCFIQFAAEPQAVEAVMSNRSGYDMTLSSANPSSCVATFAEA